MRLVHVDAEGGERALAESVETADTPLSRARGLMFRRDHEGALLFRFDRVAARSLHMAFVPFSIDAVWLIEGRVSRVARLDAWVGRGRARADAVVELPAGAADGVSAGDRLRLLD